MLLAIDVGNTAIKIGHEDAFGVLQVYRSGHGDRTVGELLSMAFDHSAKNPFGSACAVASVAPQYDPDIIDALETHGITPRFLSADDSAGLPILYETPATLGADRIANGIFLANRFTGPAISVDFGTATKLDVVDDAGAFLGGAILPGLRMMVQALNRGTAKLPEISIEVPTEAIGRSTKACLQSGTTLALAMAVEGLLRAFRDELGVAAPVVATGGLAGEFAPLCPTITVLEPNLTLEGLFIAARRWTVEI